MIERFYLSEWRQVVPWIADYQVEQDLIISRALVDLYEREKIRENLIFRGGTSLNKLFFKPPLRYSEDIDLVQINPQPIGPLIAEIRLALSWLGQPKGKLTNRSAKLHYQYTAIDNVQRKLKIEINTTEHFSVHELMDHEFAVNSSWYMGNSIVRTYQLNELIGTKLRALYQRSKGRDLFDIWFVLKMNLIDCAAVINVFNKYCDYQKLSVTRANFEKNLFEKKQNNDFSSDIVNLIADPSSWSADEAFQMIDEKIIPLLSGKPWKAKR
jgi:predicted nucleotidyltransferase component of viral defense system